MEELTRSAVAERLGIDNTPGELSAVNLHLLCEFILQPLRDAWGYPITVNSGFRCKSLNKAVGGSPSSDHLHGRAADITTGSRSGNKRLFELAVRMSRSGRISFRQLIDESGYSWLHVSIRNAYGDTKRNEVLHL